jgi:hypothetical protein
METVLSRTAHITKPTSPNSKRENSISACVAIAFQCCSYFETSEAGHLDSLLDLCDITSYLSAMVSTSVLYMYSLDRQMQIRRSY